MSFTSEGALEEELGIPTSSQLVGMLQLLMRTGLSILEADEGSLLLSDARRGDLHFVMTVGNETSGSMVIGQRVPLGVGITGLAAVTREVQVGAPIYRDLKQTERVDGSAPEAIAAAPIVLGERLLGVLTAVSFRRGRRFDTGLARMFGAFATLAAFMIDQEQRLASSGHAAAPPWARETNIEESLFTIARQRPDAMDDIAALLQVVQKLALRP